MKSAFSKIGISLLLCGAIAIAVEPVAAAPFARHGTFNNAGAARHAAARNTASMLATVRANNSAPTPSERLSNESRANANSANIMGTGTP